MHAPSPVIPVHPNPSQFGVGFSDPASIGAGLADLPIPDQASSVFISGKVLRFPITAIPAILAALCLHRSAGTPTREVDVLLQTKAQSPFDKSVIGLSKPFFLVVSAPNPG
jgi:hypothetical protein